MLRLITDFDGPIIDVSERYYCVYHVCLAEACRPNQALRPLSKEAFWQLKRACIPERQIGMRSGLDAEQAREFAALRRANVHALPYLVHDVPIPGAIAALEKLQQAGIDLVLATMRRRGELDEMLKRYNLEQFFPHSQRYCLADDFEKGTDVEDKRRLMKQAIAELPPARETWMTGDTEADMLAAKNFGIKSIGILSGIRDRNQLAHHNPDWIVNDLQEAADLVLSLSLQKV